MKIIMLTIIGFIIGCSGGQDCRPCQTNPDFDSDGIVGGMDAFQQGLNRKSGVYDPQFDMDCDQDVDQTDVEIWVAIPK